MAHLFDGFVLLFVVLAALPVLALVRVLRGRRAPGEGGRAQLPSVGRASGRYGASGETAGIRWTIETGSTQDRSGPTRYYSRWRTDAAALPQDVIVLMAGMGGKIDSARIKFGDPDASLGSTGGITGKIARMAFRLFLNSAFGPAAATAADDRLHRVKTPPPALASYHVMTSDDALATTCLAEPVPSIVAAWDAGGAIPEPSILLWSGGLMLSFEGVELPPATHERVAALGSALALAWRGQRAGAAAGG